MTTTISADRRPPTADRRPPTADRRPPTADRRAGAASLGEPVQQAFWLLRIGFTIAPIAFGLDRFAEILTNDWERFLIAGVPFNATLWFFGNTELVGHLPLYGAMLVILVWGSDPVLRPLVSGLPWRRRGRRSAVPRVATDYA